MRKAPGIFLILMVFIFAACQEKIKIEYPETKKVDTVDVYHGTEVADPYRWLEDDMSDETAAWVKKQNELTGKYLDYIPFRDDLKNRLTELWNYERFSAPSKVGDYYFFSKNDGLQEQSVVYYQKGLDGEPEVFLDPNTFSEDGTVSLAGMSFSKDHRYCAYMISRGGSDWREIYVKEVESGMQLDDKVEWVKFSGASWYRDGFYYSRYDAPTEDAKMSGSNEYQKLYYHKVGTDQSQDKLIMEDRNNKQRGWGASVTEDEKYLVINVWEGSANHNLLAYQNLETQGPIEWLIEEPMGRFYLVDNVGDDLYIQTDYNAPKWRVIKMDPENPAESNWDVIVPESGDVLQSASITGGKMFLSYLVDVTSRIRVHNLEGEFLYNVDLPALGSAGGFGGGKNDNVTFYSFTSFTYPPTIYKYDIKNNKSELFKKADINFDIENYETKQVFYESKDGTKIPMFIVHKKGLKLDGKRPTLLYAYGGFNISLTPSFRVTILPVLENDGVYAMANLRGGAEYGEEWHKAGMFEKKQNVFDDFIAAGEYLIQENYTNSSRLAIQGGSNGGLLVGAVLNQRPDLFGAAFPMVGVMDMLRYHKFTIGWAWASEYGSSDEPDQFEYLYKYSPIHNIKPGTCYPATMITTADHDDRVVPAHSFKYAATLQPAQACDNPILIRIETKAGHGAGTSTTKSIELYTDMLSFMFYNMDVSL